MTKAVDDSITKILAADAVRLVASAYGYSTARAERDLYAGLAADKIRWRGTLRGQKLDSDPGEGDPAFWRSSSTGLVQARLSENWAMRTTVAGRLSVRPGERAYRPAQRSFGFVAVELAREDVIAVLPDATKARLTSREEEAQPSRKPRRGPKKGAIARYAEGDRQHFSALRELVAKKQSVTAAALSLAGKLSGGGQPESRAKRLERLFNKENDAG